MIFNLIGPPTAGKTTLATKACIKLKGIELTSIDHFRGMSSSEEDAWGGLLSAILNHTQEHLIVESSGLSWQLKEQILPRIKRAQKPLRTIKIECNIESLRKRLLSRQEQTHLAEDMLEAERMFLDYSTPRLYIQDADLIIDTSYEPIEVSLERLTSFILINTCRKTDEDSEELGWK